MNCEESYFAKKTNRQPLYQLSVCFLYTILSFTKKSCAFLFFISVLTDVQNIMKGRTITKQKYAYWNHDIRLDQQSLPQYPLEMLPFFHYSSEQYHNL